MYLGKMIEVTREAPANLGTAMKTIIARFEDMKKDPMAILEDGVSANKVEAALATIGIALRDSEGEFRALQDVMDELGIKWNTLSRNQQAYIATVAAGSRQQSRFLAMMNNYDRTLDLISESQNSAGAAAKQYAIYQDSIAAAQARLTASWEKFYSKIVDNDIIKYVINGLTSILELLSKIPPSITAIGATIGALQLQNFITTKGGIVGILGNLLKGNNLEGEAVKTGQGIISGIVKGFTSNIKAINELSVETGKGFYTTWYEIYIKDIFGKIGKQVKNFGSTLKGLPSILKNFKGMLTPEAIGIMVAIAAIALLINHINKLKQRANDAAKAVQEISEKLTTKKDELKNRETLLNSYDELIKKTNRTTEEQQQLNDTIDEIANVYDNAITYMDEMGNMHLTNRDAIAAENKEYKEQIRILKNEVFEKQMKFLQTPQSQWTEENTAEAGLSSDFWRKFSKANNNVANLNLGDDNQYKDLESFAYGWYNTLAGSPDWREQLKNNIKEIYNIDIDTTGIENWLDVVERLKAAYVQATSDIVNSTNIVNQEIQKLSVNNWIDNLDYKSSQSGIVSYFKQLLQNLSFEDFEKYGDELQEEFEELLTKITEPDDIITAKNLFKDLVEGTIPLNEFQAKMKDLGIAISQSFIDGINKGMENKEQNAHQQALETVQAIYKDANYNHNYEKESTETLNAMSKLSEYGIKNSGSALALSDSYIEFEKIYQEMSSKGLYAGFEDAAKQILDNTELSDGLKEKGEDIISQMAEKLREEVISKNFDEAQTKIQQFTNDYKKSMGSVLKGENVKLTDTDKTSSDNGVYVDPDTGELMISISQTLLELEQQRSKIAVETALAYKQVSNELESLKNKGEDLTQEEKELLEQLENQKRILEQQYTLLNNMKLNGVQAGWATSINLAKDYQTNLKAIQSVQKTIKEQGFLDVSDMESILNIMPQYAQYFDKVGNTIAEVEGNIYTITEENIENMMKAEKERYDYKLALQQRDAAIEYEQAVKDYQYLVETYGKEIGLDDTKVQETIKNREEELNATKANAQGAIDAYEDGATGELEVQANKDNEMVNLFRTALEEMSLNYEQFLTAINSGENIKFDGIYNALKGKQIEIGAKINVNWDDLYISEGSKDRKALIQAMIEDARARMEAAWQKLQSLKSIDVPGLEKLKKSLEGSKASADKLEKAMESIAKAIETCNDAIENLDKLLKDVNKDLDDINIDYNPFMELFEAWEHEWDYYYNIKNLINLLDQQGTYLDNIISASYTSATEKLNAYDAKVGNITAKMAANDAYITTLRAGIAQQALELERKFGQYYNVDNVMGGWQIFQKDTNLTQWNEVRDAVAKTSYELNKLINEQENELNLNEAIQDALEKEQDNYQSILDTVDSLIESLSENKDITVDLSELNSIKEQLEKNLEDGALDAVKKTIKELNDYIQELNWQLDLNDNVVLDGIDDAFDDMEDGISHVQELIDTLNDTIAEQQELLESLTEIYDYYIDTAISTQQELYDAIVENYQNEINKKKEQYNYLKKLDNDYLNSIKNNISKERQAREDANKQKSYQQSLQRAQLLQMDTSGAFRSELASLNKEIESQRQDLYDDLVDKQVDALEEEIKKRQELYDLELTALEERLAYYQENAILLWEMVNQIVADGAEAMMATLENTIDYINSNELTKERQRTQWELSIRTTLRGVVDGEIENLKARIEKGNEYIKSLDEIQQAISKNTETYQQTSTILIEQNADFQAAMDAYMQVWTDMTNGLTGYYADWQTTVSAVKSAMEADIEALEALGEDGGGIKELEEKLRQSAKDMYNSFIEERKSYANQLQKVIKDIETRISAAVTTAANAIKNAVGNIQTNPSSSSNPGGGSANNPGSGNSNTPTSPSPTVQPKKYKISFQATGINLATGETEGWSKTLDGFSSKQEAINAAITFINNWLKQEGLVLQKRSSLIPVAYAKGGMADFTGPAWLDGSPSNPERILSPKQTKLFESMVSSLEQASNNSNINSALGSSYNIGDINTTIQVDKLDNDTDINRLAKQVEDKIMRTIRNRVTVSVNKGV